MQLARRANNRCRLETIADAVDVAQLIRTHPRAPGRFARDIDFTPTREQFDAHHQKRMAQRECNADDVGDAYAVQQRPDRFEAL